MILQYKGFNNNWIYEEAETITHAVVWVGKETRNYREGGVRHSLKYSEDYMRGRTKEEVDLGYAREMHEAVDGLIKEETHCCDDIAYHISPTRFDEMENVVVVTLRDKHKYVTRVFNPDGGVYLLNSRGQTVRKLAYVCSVLYLVFTSLTSGLLGSMGITVENWQFYVILFSLIGCHLCGLLMNNPFQDSNQYSSLPDDTCRGCEYLVYNSDGSVECPLEYEHKCRPETKVMYKRKTEVI